MASANFGIRQGLRAILNKAIPPGRRVFTSNGAGYVGHYLSPDFYLPLNDLGNGEVDIRIAKGIGEGTFTRATEATTVLKNGLIKKVAAGIPRSYYDSSNGEYLGYLAEGARTNLCLQSEDLGTTWGNNNSSESLNAAVAPDGTTTADKLVEDTATGQHNNLQTITYTNVVHALSIWAKPAGRDWFRLVIVDSAATAFVASFDVSSGAVGVQANCTGSIKAYPNGWYRCTIVTSTAVAAGSGTVQLQLAEADNDSSYTGDGSSGMLFWGAQLEAAVFASSYIPTTTASVTRNADVLQYLNSMSGAEFTASLEAMVPIGASDFARLLSIYTDSSNRADIEMRTTLAIRQQVSVAGAGQCATESSAITAGTPFKVAASFKADDFALSVNGAAALTDSAGTMPTVAHLGIMTNEGNGTTILGTIKNVRIWKRQLDNLSLQHLTGV